MPETLRICHLASEFTPLAKTGGLADVVGALSRYLHAQGHEVRVFLPFYSRIDRRLLRLEPVEGLQDLALSLGPHQYRYSIVSAHLPDSSLPVHLIDCPALFHRSALYTSDADDHLRFLLLTRAAIDACRRMKFEPQIFHCHDWHTALTPLYLRTSPAKTVLTIHNVGYQGVMPATALEDLDLGSNSALLQQTDLQAGYINPLRHGILYADALTTVSPTHAQEICTAQYGMGLENDLQSRRDALVGILNGIDTEEWNPATDRHLKHHYDARRLAGKKKAKAALLNRLKLDAAPDAPVIGIVSRMAQQKGFDLLFDPFPALLEKRDLRLTVLGNGEARYEEFFASLQQRFPRNVAFHRGYHDELAHQIEAGSDMFLMPSLYEPCGLNQMYSLRYGTVPIVRKTGGLADSVQHFDPATGTGTGVVFNDYDSPAVNWALNTALDWYADRKLWQRIVRNGMAQDFSWDKQGGKYVELYRRVIWS